MSVNARVLFMGLDLIVTSAMFCSVEIVVIGLGAG